ncbi:MAG: SCO family protein [Chitinophagaceae bacterium]
MNKKILFYIGFFIVLAVIFYKVMTFIIPGYGDVKLPVLSRVQPFHFTNQDGNAVTERQTDGKVYVAEYFFTTCQSICPIMNTNLQSIYDTYKNEPGFIILSHTCDPERDSVARLKVYADSLKVNTDRWWFVTGRKDSLYDAARSSYLLDDPKNSLQNINDQFIHTQFVALVDKSGHVRKIFDALKKDELQQLNKDIALLLKEPASQKKFVNNIFGN